jgi:hypothetical protein
MPLDFGGNLQIKPVPNSSEFGRMFRRNVSSRPDE